MENSGSTSTIAWLALIVGVVALLFAAGAFNGGTNVAGIGDETKDTANEIGQETKQGIALVQANFRLSAIRNEIEEEQYSEALEAVRDARSNLNDAYEKSSGDERQWWQNFDEILAMLEEQLDNDNQESLTTLDEALEELRDPGTFNS